jgi:hypothetical protein
MGNVSPVRYSKWLQIRADDDLLEALDRIRTASKPELTRADMVRRLVYDEEKRLERRK